MKKIKKAKLHVERDVLRILKTRDLCLVDGGNPMPNPNPIPITGDSKVVCCA